MDQVEKATDPHTDRMGRIRPVREIRKPMDTSARTDERSRRVVDEQERCSVSNPLEAIVQGSPTKGNDLLLVASSIASPSMRRHHTHRHTNLSRPSTLVSCPAQRFLVSRGPSSLVFRAAGFVGSVAASCRSQGRGRVVDRTSCPFDPPSIRRSQTCGDEEGRGNRRWRSSLRVPIAFHVDERKTKGGRGLHGPRSRDSERERQRGWAILGRRDSDVAESIEVSMRRRKAIAVHDVRMRSDTWEVVWSMRGGRGSRNQGRIDGNANA